jgi:hypothetical protein
MAELAQHHIERCVGIGQRLGIAFDEVDVKIGDARVAPRPL